MAGVTETAMRLWDMLRKRRITYQLACNQPAMQDMLIDLATFCGAADTCVVVDPKTNMIDDKRTYIMLGRREVFLRIQHHCNLTTQQLYKLYTGEQFNIGDDNG